MAGRAAIQYEIEAFDTSGAKLMGRHSAGESFLKAWVRYAGADPLTCYSASPRTLEAFKAQVGRYGATAPAVRAGPESTRPVAEAGALWLAGPGVGEQAWARRRADPRAWSIVGLTHTTASERAMDSIVELIRSPTETWDALICTSRSVRATVEAVLAAEQAHLTARLGASRFPRPELPIIPLGIHTDDFTPRPGAREAWRSQLGIPDGAPVVLHLGRLSFHAKAHPHPMFMAIEQGAKAAGVAPHVILAGWFANEGQERAFRDGAAAFAPSATLHVLDGRKADVRRDIWAAADVFCLMADNIQETFGLAPVEAMAAGLPVVVSDWDGFRDTVEHQVHGFRIRSLQAPAGSGDSLAARHEGAADTYDRYIAAACQFAAIDVAAAGKAFAVLFSEPDKARSMGAIGQAHARTSLDWRAIIPRYLDLLAELSARRNAQRGAPRPKSDSAVNPGRLDPFFAFGAYPTDKLAGRTRLTTTERGRAISRQDFQGLWNGAPQPQALAPADMLHALMLRAADGATVADLVRPLSGEPRIAAIRSLVWLGKMDLLSWERG